MLVVILISVAVTLPLRQAMGIRAGNKAVIDKKRQTNKRSNNRIVITIDRAGKRYSPFALARHTGRKSGKQYVILVRLIQHDNNFTIPLTYGERADWYQNLQTAGKMEIQWQGVTYQVGHPERLEISHAVNDFPLISRFLFWLDGIPAFVRVTMIS